MNNVYNIYIAEGHRFPSVRYTITKDIVDVLLELMDKKRFYKEASLEECAELGFKNLIITEDKLESNDLNALSDECNKINARLTITDNKLKVMIPVLEDFSDDAVKSNVIESETDDKKLEDIIQKVSEKFSKEMNDIVAKLSEQFVDKDKLQQVLNGLLTKEDLVTILKNETR